MRDLVGPPPCVTRNLRNTRCSPRYPPASIPRVAHPLSFSRLASPSPGLRLALPVMACARFPYGVDLIQRRGPRRMAAHVAPLIVARAKRRREASAPPSSGNAVTGMLVFARRAPSSANGADRSSSSRYRSLFH